MLYNPIFDSIMSKIKSMSESDWDTPTGKQLWRLASKHTPPELQKMFIKGAQEKGLFPKPTRCDENGDALYCLEEISDFFGMTREEGKQAYQEMLEAEPDICEGFHQGAVYVIQ